MSTMQGILWKWTNYWNGWQTRWFTLENGILSYYKSEEEVNQGCKGSLKVVACQINVSQADGTRLDLIIPGEQHLYLKTATFHERQQWLIALGSAKACVKPELDTNQDILKTKRSELKLYCDLLMQQVHTIKTAATNTNGPQLEVLNETTNMLSLTCDTVIKTLEECCLLANSENNGFAYEPQLKNSTSELTLPPNLTKKN